MKNPDKASRRRYLNSKGYSLVELIVVISIMAIMTGVLSLGISIMFSRDAESVATTISDSMSKARTYSMTKPGNFTLTVHLCASGTKNTSETYYNYITLENDISDPADGGYSEDIYFKANAVISAPGMNPPSDGDEIVVVFDKSNGSVKSIKINGTDITASGIYTIECTGVRNSTRTAKVNLMTVTGRNSIGEL